MVGALSMKYVSGRPDLGQSPQDGFDCSGFVTFVLRTAGLSAPYYLSHDGSQRPIRHANEYWDHYGVAVHPPLRRPGDLIFFSRSGVYPSHIGIVWDKGSYIHAPGYDFTRVCIEDIEESYIAFDLDVPWPQLYTVNPIGYKSPTAARRGHRFYQKVI